MEEHTPEEVDGFVRKAITESLGDFAYDNVAADVWCDQILDRSLKAIASLGKPFKYIATCVISRHTAHVIDTAATAFW
eukprot:CAMPEP_0194482706 /NCGR_PEP_ID=MMETSP0253-20130528/4533_1 /TAXON_ID=2966 /ORGANISM="Noctiluca scintillans" /LENGTH=77 /DNA_ID=CAMNT_0039322263 /DNA_START=58 /DNA_END=288 /DNA_ORIENTATION=+